MPNPLLLLGMLELQLSAGIWHSGIAGDPGDCLLVWSRKLRPALGRGAQRTHVPTRGLTEGGDVFSVIAMAMVAVLLSSFPGSENP